MEIILGNDWDRKIGHILNGEGFGKFYSKIKKEYDEKTIFPKEEDIFNALKLTSYSDTRVVILGQDPYHGENEAMGLSFSVQEGTKIPPSLKNIYKELEDDLGIAPVESGDLTKWAKQGVLLLNSCLTVQKGKANSHQGMGWELLTDCIIRILNKKEEPVVFILWGNFAKEKEKLITNDRHLVIKSAHPSPLSAPKGFFGSKPFSKTNEFLDSNNEGKIDWDLSK